MRIIASRPVQPQLCQGCELPLLAVRAALGFRICVPCAEERERTERRQPLAHNEALRPHRPIYATPDPAQRLRRAAAAAWKRLSPCRRDLLGYDPQVDD